VNSALSFTASSRLSKVWLFSVVGLFPAIAVTLYRYRNPRAAVGDILLIVVFCVLVGIASSSAIRGPRQFVVATGERIFYPFFLVLALGVYVVSFFASTLARAVRIVIAFIGAAFYGVMPFDIIPDFFLGIGQLDDIAVGILSLYWGIFAGNMIMRRQMRSYARSLQQHGIPRTAFP
jgi:uncharacterized membrane protein YkvA (DUF1232 family)